MISDITVGQFFPGNSVLHRINPAMKLILTLIFIVDVFLAETALSMGVMLIAVMSMIPIAGISVKTVLRSLKPLRIIMIFTAVLNIFMAKGEKPLFSRWIFTVYPEGLIRTVLIVVRVIILLVGTTLLVSYTTSPIALTDGLEQLLSPLKKLHLNVHEFSMMMTIALRFIPTLIEETEKIISAQKSRGADFSTGSPIKRIKALIPIFIPLFVSCIRRAEELATAMECRCYNGGIGKTRMNVIKYRPIDFLALLCFAALGAGIVFLNTVPSGMFSL